MNINVTTTNLRTGELWTQSTAKAIEGLADNYAVYLYSDIKGQTFDGFGGAFTEAASVNWHALSPKNQQAFMDAYFGRDGLRYSIGRTHMNSCDFALGNYACVDDPADEALEYFQTTRDETYLFPMIRAAGQAAGKPIELMLSPWSPPSFMKTNGEMNHGGQLKPEYKDRWAQCIARYVAAYRAQGFCVRNLTVQNEPAAVQTWDSCIYSGAEEADFAANHLVPALEQAGITDVDIFVWDHNKELLVRRMQESFADPEQAQKIAGAAFHWYTGDHFEAIEMARALYPDKKFYFSEGCVEYSRFDGMTDLEKAEMYAHDILGNLNAGNNGSLDWNLLLDAKGGPNHVGNFCEAPIMLCENGGLDIKGSYYYIGQFSRFIQPGAVKIGVSRWCTQIEATAFQNPDGTTAVVLLNRSEQDLDFHLCIHDSHRVPLSLAAHSIASVAF